MKISIYIAASFDGFIARSDGDIEWLVTQANPNESEDYGYSEFIASIDCIVMGRNTFEKVITFPEWPYEKPVIVLTNTLKTLPQKVVGKVELYSGNIESLVSRLKLNNINRIYLDGGKTIQSFLRDGYITDLTITHIPILLGSGIPLFGAIKEDIKLKHLETKFFKSGFVQSKYMVGE